MVCATVDSIRDRQLTKCRVVYLIAPELEVYSNQRRSLSGPRNATSSRWPALSFGGIVVDHGPDTIAVGDLIQVGSPGWHQVVKINRKTVAVPSGHSWTNKIEYHRITGHRAAVSSSPSAGES